jgi:putative tryptophan/tyrosine transport system substrate-binding protein
MAANICASSAGAAPWRHDRLLLYICADALTTANRNRIPTFALVARLPTISESREQLEGGGLMSYGPNFVDLFRRAGDYVDKILGGAKSAGLPVQQPTKSELVINLITATAWS